MRSVGSNDAGEDSAARSRRLRSGGAPTRAFLAAWLSALAAPLSIVACLGGATLVLLSSVPLAASRELTNGCSDAFVAAVTGMQLLAAPLKPAPNIGAPSGTNDGEEQQKQAGDADGSHEPDSSAGEDESACSARLFASRHLPPCFRRVVASLGLRQTTHRFACATPSDLQFACRREPLGGMLSGKSGAMRPRTMASMQPWLWLNAQVRCRIDSAEYGVGKLLSS